MDEHIQIPKSLLKSFSTTKHTKNADGLPVKQQTVYVLNSDLEIQEKDIKDCNTQIGYYDLETEAQIARAETAFGDLKKKIITTLDRGKSLSFDEKDLQVAQQFFRLCKYRSPNFHEKITESVEKQFPDVDFTGFQNYIVQHTPDLKVLKHKNRLCVLYNETSQNFIIPQSCWYLWGIPPLQVAILPLTPKIALSLFHGFANTHNVFHSVNSSAFISYCNRFAIVCEFAVNHQFVYAKHENDLTQHITFIKEHRNEFQI